MYCTDEEDKDICSDYLPLTDNFFLDTLGNLKCTKRISKAEEHCLKITFSEENTPNIRFTLSQSCHLQISRFHESSRW